MKRVPQNTNRLQLKWGPPNEEHKGCQLMMRKDFYVILCVCLVLENVSIAVCISYKRLSSLSCCFLSFSVPKLWQKREASALKGHAKKKMEELQSRAESAQASLDKAGFEKLRAKGP